MTPPDQLMDFLSETAPEHVTNGQLCALLLHQSGEIRALMAAQTEANKRIERIETNTQGMVKAWNSGGVMLDLAKWITGIAVAVGVAYAWAKGLSDFFGKH